MMAHVLTTATMDGFCIVCVNRDKSEGYLLFLLFVYGTVRVCVYNVCKTYIHKDDDDNYYNHNNVIRK